MSGGNLATMAWRNIWRNRRRTLITLFGISFGVLLAVIFTGIGDWTYTALIDKSARLGTGHVTVQHPDYQELPTLKKTVPDADEIEKVAAEDPRVVRAVSRIQGAALIATAAGSQGAFFMAVDPEREDGSSMEILDFIKEGEMLSSADANEVVLGYKLADALGVELGKKLVYTMTDRNGEIVSGLARVKGLVRTGAPSVDGGLCLLPIGAVRKLLGYQPGEATQVAVFLADQRDSAAVADALRPEVGDSVTLTWDEVSPDLAGFIAMKQGGTIIMEVIIMVLLAAGIFNTLFVSVMERMREFGIMAALGYSARSLFGLVMWECMWLAVAGVVFSALVTAFPYYHLNTAGIDYSQLIGEGAEVAGVGMDPFIYVSIFPQHAINIALAVVFATLASGIYPAWRAGRTNPADVIRLQ